jgi:hypothetical protein
MSGNDLFTTGDPYTELTKEVVPEDNYTYVMDGENQYIYYAFPTT